MTDFNKNNINHSNFQGRINRAAAKAPKEIKTMEEQIKKMVQDLLKQESYITEYGDFSLVYSEFKNPIKDLIATDFMLKVSKPPKHIENNEKKRYLEVVAYKLPAPIKSTRIIAVGEKDDILKKLKEPDIIKTIEKAARELSENLNDV